MDIKKIYYRYSVTVFITNAISVYIRQLFLAQGADAFSFIVNRIIQLECYGATQSVMNLINSFDVNGGRLALTVYTQAKRHVFTQHQPSSINILIGQEEKHYPNHYTQSIIPKEKQSKRAVNNGVALTLHACRENSSKWLYLGYISVDAVGRRKTVHKNRTDAKIIHDGNGWCVTLTTIYILFISLLTFDDLSKLVII